MPTERSQSPRLSPACTRRAWLASLGAMLGAMPLAAAQLPPGVGVAAAPPCDPATTPTPMRRVQGFQPGVPRDGHVAAGSVLAVTGTVAGVRCGLIAGATVDWWHAVGALVHRGRAVTDQAGRYRVETPMPVGRAGAAPRMNLRVQVPGKLVFTTEVFVPPVLTGEAHVQDPSFDPRLAMTVLERRAARAVASFNVILDL